MINTQHQNEANWSHLLLVYQTYGQNVFWYISFDRSIKLSMSQRSVYFESTTQEIISECLNLLPCTYLIAFVVVDICGCKIY